MDLENDQPGLDALALRLVGDVRTLRNVSPVVDWERFEVVDTIVYLTQR